MEQLKHNTQRSELTQVALTALVVLFGLQTVRVLLPLLLFVLKDRFAWTAIQVGLFAAVLFSSSFFVGPLLKAVGPRKFLLGAVSGLGVTRLGQQLWWGDPLIDLFLVCAATIFFLWAFPLCLEGFPTGVTSKSRLVILGLPLGLVLDSAFHGLYGTYDMSWHHDLKTAVVVGALVLGQGWALKASTEPWGLEAEHPSMDRPWFYLTLGPYLFLQLLIFGNMARLAALTNWDLSYAYLWVLSAMLLGFALSVSLVNHDRWKPPFTAIVCGIALVLSVLTPWPSGWTAAFLLLIGQLCGLALVTLASLPRPTLSKPLKSDSDSLTAFGCGMLLFILLVFLYYASYELPIPIPNSLLAPAAGFCIALTACLALRSPNQAPSTSAYGPLRSMGIFATTLILLPLLQIVANHSPTTVTLGNRPLRIMTYNLHNGFDPRGHLGMEAIARAIEAEQADVVAVQEVSRGWVVYGSLDMMTWLSRRLSMPYIYGATADPLWGNALLSRAPLFNAQLVDLPPDHLPLPRGLISAEIILGPQHRLRIATTHFH